MLRYGTLLPTHIYRFVGLKQIVIQVFISVENRDCHNYYLLVQIYVNRSFRATGIYRDYEYLSHIMNITGSKLTSLDCYYFVGLVVVICEALDDSGLFCLMMLLVVVEADHFYAVFCRSTSSKKYWPRLIFVGSIVQCTISERLSDL